LIVCPNCETENPVGSRFCAECGASLATAKPAPRETPPTAPEWRMSDAGPLPEPRRGRRKWLWFALAIIGACLLCCVAFFVWSATDAGQGVLNDASTRFAEVSTEAAAE